MGLSKPVKKKKKVSKTEKCKKNDKKMENQKVAPPPTAAATLVDRKTEAENNLKEMLKEAHKMHKNHLRATIEKNLLLSTRASERDKFNKAKLVNSQRCTPYSSYESLKRPSKTSKEGDTSSADGKRRQKSYEEFKKRKVKSKLSIEMQGLDGKRKGVESKRGSRRTKEIPNRTFGDSDDGAPRRTSTGELPVRKKEPGGRRGSADFPQRRAEEAVWRQGSAELPRRKTADGHRVKKSKKLKNETSTEQVQDYQIGSSNFVSLELLDKMKCRSSNEIIREKKSAQKSRHVKSRDTVASASKDSTVSRKKEKSGDKSKKSREESGKKKKSDAVQKEDSKKSAAKSHRGTHRKKNENSETSTDSQEQLKKKSQVKVPPKSAMRNVMSSSSNNESGMGDLFSTNTSRSYSSTESDISKIDRKFMQILEAVSPNHFKFGFDEKFLKSKEEKSCEPKIEEKIEEKTEPKEENSQSDRDLLAVPEPVQEIKSPVKMRKRKTVDNRVTEVETPVDKEEEVGDVSVKIEESSVGGKDVKELWTKQNGNQGSKRKLLGDEALKSFAALKVISGSEVEKICRAQNQEKTETEVMEVHRAPNPPEAKKRRISRKPPPEEAKKSVEPKAGIETGTTEIKVLKPERKPLPAQSRTEITVMDSLKTKEDKVDYKRIKTWNIIKRLEKALETLGLDLKDLENSDEESCNTVKKSPVKLRKSKEGETKKKALDMPSVSGKSAESHRSAQKKTASVKNVGAESNGAGDRNIEARLAQGIKKVEELMKMSSRRKVKGENKFIYFASTEIPTPVLPKEKIREQYEGLAKNIFPDSLLLTLPNKKHCSENAMKVENMPLKKTDASAMTLPACNEMSETTGRLTAERKLKLGKKPVKRQRKLESHLDDIQMDLQRYRYGRKGSECSLTVSCSLSSLSDDDEMRRLKSKWKKMSSKAHKSTDTVRSEDELWSLVQAGNGDSIARDVRIPEFQRVLEPEERSSCGSTDCSELYRTANRYDYKADQETNELELMELRERHKQLISEIRVSLDEIRKQHDLYSRLQKQTKQFNRDCHTKRKLIASYLKDVQANFERRKPRLCNIAVLRDKHPAWKYPRTGSDRYYYTLRRSSRDRLSEDERRLLRLKKKLRHRPGECWRRLSDWSDSIGSVFSNDASSVTDYEDISPAMFGRTSTEPHSTDRVSEESFKSVASIPKTYRSEFGSSGDETIGEEPAKKSDDVMEKLCGEWRRLQEEQRNCNVAPNHFVRALEMLNRLILNERSEISSMVTKASDGGGSTPSRSRRGTDAQAQPSKGSNAQRGQRERKASGTPRTSMTDERDPDPPERKQSGKSEKPTTPSSARKPSISSKTSAGEQKLKSRGERPTTDDRAKTGDPPIKLHEDEISEQLHLEMEEMRYRKGDPSFQFKGYLLDYLGQKPPRSTSRTPEEEAYRRKMELARILQDEDDGSRRFHRMAANDDHGMRHNRRERQSILLDHSSAEENEESATVLGHASRHSGMGRRKHDRKKFSPELHIPTDSHEVSHWRHQNEANSHVRNFTDQVTPILREHHESRSFHKRHAAVRTSRDAESQTDHVEDLDELHELLREDARSHE